MPITTIEKDPANLTITVVADFPVPLQRLWDAYVDPRQIEKFWGPPTFPATFTRHDVYPGGLTNYVMTGPNGEQSGGYWEWLDVKAPAGGDVGSFEVTDGFAHEDGSPNTDMPTGRMVFQFESTDAGSRVTVTSHHNSAEDLQMVLDMGMEEGMKEAMGQIDDVLADLQSFAADRPTHTQILSDTQVRISRIIRGSVEDVWRANHEPDFLKRWLLGPDGWEMTECTVATEPGQTSLYRWAPTEGTEGEPFALTQELIEQSAPNREVVIERMEGVDDGDGVHYEVTYTPAQGGTLLCFLMTAPSKEVRDAMLATGMTEGMEASYVRLEETVLAA